LITHSTLYYCILNDFDGVSSSNSEQTI